MGIDYCNLEVVTRLIVFVPGATQREGADELWLQWFLALKTKKILKFAATVGRYFWFINIRDKQLFFKSKTYTIASL